MPIWTPYSHPISLQETFLHIYRYALTDASLDPYFSRLLSQDERLRFDKLLLPAKKCQFLRSRAVLRKILSFYLNNDPSSIQILTNSHGKPSLQINPSALHFNVSHAADCLLLAISSTEVGVDVEYIKEALDFNAIAAQFFEKGELEVLQTFSRHRQRRAFYRLWTKKESTLKMLGCGFSGTAGDLKEDSWQRYLYVGRRYVASVVTREDPGDFRCYNLTSTELVR